MFKKHKYLLMAFIATAMMIFIIGGCSDDNGGGKAKGPADSVEDYSNLEPPMAPNPNRSTARVGANARIEIPEYLLSPAAFSSASTAAVTATFRVHDDDVDIAQIVSQDGSTCTVKGLQLGSARIIITVGSQSATVIIAVSPSAALYTLPAAEVRRLGDNEFYNAWWNNSRPDNLPNDYSNYNSEPTYQLAWNWRNKGQSHGASGGDCGIDILAYFVDPGVADRRGWVRTTYGFGGWHYDLNGESDNMTNGVQTAGDLKLELKPEFTYDNGVPYLQITHELTNTGAVALTGQKFGASADVMIFNQDDAPLTYMPYGALMTNENVYNEIHYLPTVKLRLISQNLRGVDDVSTMWFGEYLGGGERSYIYDDNRTNIDNSTVGFENIPDTALNFSYQDINLAPGESKTFVVRFTQVQ